MTTNEIFKRMLDWICDNQLAPNQTEVARAAGLNETTVSRIVKGHVKSVKQETLRAINAAYGNVFNPDWLRGESGVMHAEDLAQEGTLVGVGVHGKASTPAPTDLTTQLLAAKDEIIATLRNQLTDKDALIESKERYINILQQQLIDLRNPKRLQDAYPFVPSTTEDNHK